MKKYHLYGIGAALVDTEIQVSDAELAAMGVEKGLMTLVDEPRQQTLLDQLEGHLVHSKQASGGSACNSVSAAAYFGARCFFSGKVANDEFGQLFLNDVSQAGIATPGAAGSDGVTGKCLVLITPDAERSMNTYLGVSASLSVAELDEQALTESEYFYIEGYLVTSDSGRAAAIRGREIAGRTGVKTALSFSDPGIVAHFRDGLKDMIGEGIDLLFCNEAEALSWSGESHLQAAAEQLKSVAKTFAITLGSKGALVFDGEAFHDIPALPVTAVDTNGAGDMFAGAFLYALTHGFSYQQAGQLAAQAAGQVVSQYGPRLPGHSHQEILQAVFG